MLFLHSTFLILPVLFYDDFLIIMIDIVYSLSAIPVLQAGSLVHLFVDVPAWWCARRAVEAWSRSGRWGRLACRISPAPAARRLDARPSCPPPLDTPSRW